MKSGLRYELAVNIKTGDICWENGGFPCGMYGDLEIFRSALSSYLEEFERVEADDGYIGYAPMKVRCPKCVTVPCKRKRMMAIVRMRHETMNRRLKQWRCLKGVWRHDIEKHSIAFRAVVVMTQLAIANGEPLFQVEYSDNFDVSDDEDQGFWEWGDGNSDQEEEAVGEDSDDEEEYSVDGYGVEEDDEEDGSYEGDED